VNEVLRCTQNIPAARRHKRLEFLCPRGGNEQSSIINHHTFHHPAGGKDITTSLNAAFIKRL
jgi:hypothetical protein